jgi:hypothetical protein
MPMYYFNLNDDETVVDTDGTDLPDVGAARIHATGVARELTSNGGGILTQSWSGWTMSVQDAHGTELFSLTMTDFGDGDPEKINPDRSVHRGEALPVAPPRTIARMRLERSLHCGIRPGCVYGLLASTMLYPLPKTKTFDVRQIMRSSSTMVRMRSRNFHSSRC